MEQRPIGPDDVFWQLASLNQRIARIEQLLELLPILLVAQVDPTTGIPIEQVLDGWLDLRIARAALARERGSLEKKEEERTDRRRKPR